MTENKMITNDSLVNFKTGVGTERDSSIYNFYVRDYISHEQAGAIYRGNGLGRKIIDLPIHDMLKNWRIWNSSTDQDKIHTEEKRLHLKKVISEAVTNADIYGGAVIIMLFNDRNSLEVPLTDVQKGSLDRLLVLDPGHVSKLDYNMTDPLAPQYLEATYYQIGSSEHSPKVHASRVIEFAGSKLPLRERILGASIGMWGDSRYSVYNKALKGYDSIYSSISQIIKDATLDIQFVDEATSNLTSSAGESAMSRRAEEASLTKSMFHTVLMNKDERFERFSSSVASYDKILSSFKEEISAVSSIPYTKLFGSSADGMNATGLGDRINYHESLEIRQDDLTYTLEKLDNVFKKHLGLSDDDTYEWAPLRVKDEADEINNMKTFFEASTSALNIGVLHQEEIRKAVKDFEWFDIEDENEVNDVTTEDENDVDNDRQRTLPTKDD